MKGLPAADTPVDVLAGEHIEDAVVTLVDHPTRLQGALTDVANKPVSYLDRK